MGFVLKGLGPQFKGLGFGFEDLGCDSYVILSRKSVLLKIGGFDFESLAWWMVYPRSNKGPPEYGKFTFDVFCGFFFSLLLYLYVLCSFLVWNGMCLGNIWSLDFKHVVLWYVRVFVFYILFLHVLWISCAFEKLRSLCSVGICSPYLLWKKCVILSCD